MVRLVERVVRVGGHVEGWEGVGAVVGFGEGDVLRWEGRISAIGWGGARTWERVEWNRQGAGGK